MPLVGFICPDGEKISIEECLSEGGCRMKDRCASRTYLQMAASQRPWTGTPSTTQLISGTMLSYLRIKEPYYVAPDDRAFMLHGTLAHAKLTYDDEYSIVEEKLQGEGTEVTGIFDIYQVENGKATLIDTKTSGSYKVVKALGFYQEKEPTGKFYKSGPRKGQPKFRKVTKQSDEHIDRWEWELQLNMYRIQLERQGFPVHRLQIQCIPRDGGTHIAKSRGVNRNLYLFDINRLDDEIVLEYFKRKRRALLYALKYGWSKPCNADENWDGIRCARYCEVAQFCPLGQYMVKEKEKLIMPIEGLSEVERPQISGKIRLGRKVPNKSGNGEHPEELKYFRIDPTHIQDENLKDSIIREFHDLYGEEPTMINVIFPSDDLEVIFPQYYTAYGSTAGMKCKGDGKTADCFSDEMLKVLTPTGTKGATGRPQVYCKGAGEIGKEETTACPYFKANKCNRVARLRFLIPDMKGTTLWECVTGSINSIINVNSALKHFKRMVGRFDWIPLQLMRIPLHITKDGNQRTHYPLAIDMNISILEIMKYAKLEPIQVLESHLDIEDDLTDLQIQGPGDAKAISKGKMPSLPEKVEDSTEVIQNFEQLAYRLAEDWNEDADVIKGFLVAKLDGEEKAYEVVMFNLSDAEWMRDLKRLFGQWVVAEAKIDDEADVKPEPKPEPEQPEKPKQNGNGKNGKGEYTFESMMQTLCLTLGVEMDELVSYMSQKYTSKGKSTLYLKRIIEDSDELQKFEAAYTEWEETNKDSAEEPMKDEPLSQDDLPM